MHANRRRNATHWPCLPHGLTSPHVVIELLVVVELSVVVVLSAVVVVVVDGDAVPVETLEKNTVSSYHSYTHYYILEGD